MSSLTFASCGFFCFFFTLWMLTPRLPQTRGTLPALQLGHLRLRAAPPAGPVRVGAAAAGPQARHDAGRLLAQRLRNLPGRSLQPDRASGGSPLERRKGKIDKSVVNSPPFPPLPAGRPRPSGEEEEPGASDRRPLAV